jgi:fatty-acyl-CoA synthase
VFALLARWPSALAVGERARAGGIAVGPELEVRVIDPDSGTERAIGQDGELCFRGPAVLACYLGDPAATDAALAPDGWFRSGDLGRLTRDGGFEYLARLGDSLRLRGFLVDPAEIERIIELHPAVDVAQVVGVERDAVGHVAVAFVRVVEPLTVDALRTHCASRIAAFKVPAAFVFVEEFPTVAGPNGVKIRKRELRDLAAAHVLAGDGGEAS